MPKGLFKFFYDKNIFHHNIISDKKNNALETNLNLPQYNSINRIEEKPYERVRYDKIQPTEEHPYAQLQPSSSRSAVHEDAQGTTEERATLLR